ncbi:hypothetical protein HJC23_009033 [Cyclotella cryptica]|uniref:Nudix hydrolase domain-containing protein n=1 Tax=Cyclotella cryptica TaxID=29204 RepID=A0ABD3R0G3_9STRA|eukprot:CCRYP_000636-RA/>CCRYP_000636-RA protein AED:0.00 eAED:0.00 QI:189/-1/1/1/-1/1/1/394/377
MLNIPKNQSCIKSSVFMFTVFMSISWGRRAILCCGQKTTSFLHPAARFGSGLPHRLATKVHRRQSVPFYTKQSLLFSSTAPNHVSKKKEVDQNYDFDRILPFDKHSHNSIKIAVPQNEQADPSEDLFDSETFLSKLEATVATAKQLHKTAIWITVPITRAGLMEHAHKCGFTFHHAEGNTATLSKWLSEDEESRIPTFATHQVGVGAVVINRETEEILCVREKRNNYRPWKMPGGLAELGEELDIAVIREVYEETGIQCRFLSVLGVRHTHGLQFGRSDLYFVCRLEPVTDESGKVAQPVPQEGEIEAAAWIPLDEYRDMVNNPDSNIGHPMMRHIMKIVDQGDWDKFDIQRTVVSSVVPGRKGSPVYHAPIHSDSN